MNSVEKWLNELGNYDFNTVIKVTEFDIFVNKRIVLFEKIGNITTGYSPCENDFNVLQDGAELTQVDFESIYDMFS